MFTKPNAEWYSATLAKEVPWQEAYPSLEKIVRNYLIEADINPGLPLGTAELVGEIAPVEELRQHIQRRLYHGLMALAEHGLADCATKGDAVTRRDKTVRPWRWHRPVEGRAVAMPASSLVAEHRALVARVAALEATVFAMQGENEDV